MYIHVHVHRAVTYRYILYIYVYMYPVLHSGPVCVYIYLQQRELWLFMYRYTFIYMYMYIYILLLHTLNRCINLLCEEIYSAYMYECQQIILQVMYIHAYDTQFMSVQHTTQKNTWTDTNSTTSLSLQFPFTASRLSCIVTCTCTKHGKYCTTAGDEDVCTMYIKCIRVRSQ